MRKNKMKNDSFSFRIEKEHKKKYNDLIKLYKPNKNISEYLREKFIEYLIKLEEITERMKQNEL